MGHQEVTNAQLVETHGSGLTEQKLITMNSMIGLVKNHKGLSDVHDLYLMDGLEEDVISDTNTYVKSVSSSKILGHISVENLNMQKYKIHHSKCQYE